MSYLRIIPSLLLSQGKLVKGVGFKNHRNAGSPASTIVALESQGADEISLIDIDSYINNKKKEPDFEILKKISETSSTPITFGGGITNLEIAKKVIRSGAEKIYLNRAILNSRDLIQDIVKYFGGQAIVIGINLIKFKDSYKIYEDLNNKINLLNYISEIQNLGIGEIKINFVDREGKKEGLDLEFSEKILNHIRVSCIFEGGIGSLNQIEDAFNKKINAVALGTMITFNDYNIFKIKRYLFDKNYNVRL
jgi:imidazole glycerol-phosphate synthase subunit HisF